MALPGKFGTAVAGTGGTDPASCSGDRRGAAFGRSEMAICKLGLRREVDGGWTGRINYGHDTQTAPRSEVSLNIPAPGVIENLNTSRASLRSGDYGKRIIVLKYDPIKTFIGVNTVDPTQPIERKMRQFEFEFGYAWR
jgi:hypothetical protein